MRACGRSGAKAQPADRLGAAGAQSGALAGDEVQTGGALDDGVGAVSVGGDGLVGREHVEGRQGRVGVAVVVDAQLDQEAAGVWLGLGT